MADVHVIETPNWEHIYLTAEQHGEKFQQIDMEPFMYWWVGVAHDRSQLAERRKEHIAMRPHFRGTFIAFHGEVELIKQFYAWCLTKGHRRTIGEEITGTEYLYLCKVQDLNHAFDGSIVM